MTEPTFLYFLREAETRKCEITPFKYNDSHSCTKDFARWWDLHYSVHLVDKRIMMGKIREGFNPSAVAAIQLKLTSKGSKSRVASNASSQAPLVKVKEEPG
ncbi:hypothetical protein A2U01_0038465, partial [Trifolium medium]|nr:hypothetical protein [Trifolium medium]